MKFQLLLVAILFAIFLSLGCKKTESDAPINFTTSLDSINQQLNIKDSIQLSLYLKSTMPRNGIAISINVKRNDNQTTTFNLDTITNSPTLIFKTGGFRVQTSYTITIKVNSRSVLTNNAIKTYNAINDPLGRATITYKSIPFEISIPNYPEPQFGLASIQNGNSGTLLYSVDGIEHIIATPGTRYPSPPLHFTKTPTTEWVFEDYYWDGKMDGARNYSFLDKRGTIAYANHGTEAINPWPLGELYVVRTSGQRLSWTKISELKSFFHGVASGDINNDGLPDIVGVKFPGLTTGTWVNNALEPYFQLPNQQFQEQRNLMALSNAIDDHSGSTALVLDVMGDNRPEIIRCEYSGNLNNPSSRYGFAIYKYNITTNKYEFVKKPASLGVFQNMNQGATSIQPGDFNRDGNVDLAIATEGNPGNYIQIWNGNGQGDFTPGQSLLYTEDQVEFREFEVADFDEDGWLDIILHPTRNTRSILFFPNGGNSPYGIVVQNCLWKNNNGNFSFITKQLSVPSINPGFLRGFFINGKIKFIGFESTPGFPANFNKFSLHEIIISF